MKLFDFRWISVACSLAAVVNGLAGHYETAALNVIGALLAMMVWQREERP